ncbi:alpha/beta hydrolase family protein [Asticcacaulis sp. AND118]|uniref:alpha/beta hydrolase n=1 Tax=Asticcacaulis sp. AND118 TaxID=2840468 RepID=UPI001CFFC85E|nr:alpha/beta hydrolase-fold protein [Asticcacaulis sp. AND118]UDF03054.1 esterase [Asticcacaulis sp. AND118]
MKGWSVFAVLLALVWSSPLTAQSRLDHRQIRAASLTHNIVGMSPMRGVTVYLPSGYDTSGKRYPVIYFLNNFKETETAPFDNSDAQTVFDAGIAQGAIGGVIVVTADFSTPLGSSWYVNSPVTGNWQDFMVTELVPYIDAHYRTLASSASRGIAGDRMGGYGALRFGMTNPETFGAVYALHPVGTGAGVQTMHSRPDWGRLQGAPSLKDFEGDLFGGIFLSIYQAHLPDPTRPPLYVDLPARRENGRLAVDDAQTARLIGNFLLVNQLPKHAGGLKRLRGLKFDWGRNDGNYDHVLSNQAFAHMLDEYGVPHEAEEYHGGWGDRVWGADGRVATDLLPFFSRTLVFQ